MCHLVCPGSFRTGISKNPFLADIYIMKGISYYGISVSNFKVGALAMQAGRFFLENGLEEEDKPISTSANLLTLPTNY